MDPNNTIDQELFKKEEISERHLKIEKRLNLLVFITLMPGWLFKFLYLPGADILLHVALVVIFINGIFRFVVTPDKNILAILHFLSAILGALWMVFYLYKLPFERMLLMVAVGTFFTRSILVRLKKK